MVNMTMSSNIRYDHFPWSIMNTGQRYILVIINLTPSRSRNRRTKAPTPVMSTPAHNGT